MKIKTDQLQNSSLLDDKATTLNPLAVDLSQFANEKINRTLAFNGKIIGQVLIKDDCFYLNLEENAPKVTLTGLPLQKKVIIDAANDITLATINPSQVAGLIVNANNIITSETLNISKAVSLNAKQKLTLESALTSAEIACKACDFETNKSIHSTSSFTLKADNAHLAGTIDTKVLVLNVKHLEDSAESKIKAQEKMVLLSESVKLKGNLDEVDNLFCKSHDLSISGSIKQLDNAYLECDNLLIHEQGHVEFKHLTGALQTNLRTISAKTMVLKPSAKGVFNQNKLSINALDSHGYLTIKDSMLTADTLDLNGLYTLQSSHCDVSDAIHFKGVKGALAKETVFEAQSCHFEGENTCQNVEFITDDMEFLANTTTTLNASRLDVINALTLNEQSNTQWQHCAIYTTSAQYNGKAQLEHCSMESETCVTSDQTILDSTALEARLFWQDKGAKIKKCGIKATSSTLLNQTSMEETKLKTDSLISASAGTFKHCKVKVNNALSGTDKSNLTFQQCLLKTDKTYTDGALNFTKESYHQTNYLQQTSGTITLNNSVIDSNGSFFTMSNTRLIVEENAKIKAQSALLKGESDWKLSKMATTGPLIVSGKTSAQKTTIASVDDSIHFTNHCKTFEESILGSKNNISVLSDLSLSNHSELICNELSISSNNALLEDSGLNVQALNVLNQFCAKKSHITVKSDLNTLQSSSIAIEDSTVTAKDMHFMGTLNLARSELKAEASMVFENAKANINKVKLEAKEQLINKESSDITGSEVETKSNHFSQAGTLKIEDLKVNANTIIHSGTTQSDKSVQFKANESLVNTGSLTAQDLKIQASSMFNVSGQIGSTKSTTIQAPLIVNHMGDINSRGALSMDSLVHLNLLGIERAYDYTSKSVYNGNYGLITPNLPNSVGELLTTQRGWACAKMALTQWLPDYSNLISLGWKAAPLAKSSAQFLYDFYKSNESIKNLPAKIYDSKSAKDFREQFIVNDTSDYLPCAMNIMSTGLSVMQLGNELAGAYNEVQAARTSSTPPAQEKQEAEKPETEKKDEEESNVSKAFKFAVDIAANNFMPTLTSQSVWSENSGLMGGGLVTDSAFYDSNHGIKGGWNFAGNYRQGVNKGIYAGAKLVMKGDSYLNEGDITSRRSASILFRDSFKNAEGASLDLTNFQVKTNQFINEANLDLNTGSIEATTFLQTETGQANIAKTNAKIKENATLNGQYAFSDESSIDAKSIDLHGEGSFNQSSARAEESLTQHGQLTATQSDFSGKNVSLNGFNATDGTVKAQNELHIKNANTLGTGLSAEKATLEDSTFKAKQSESDSQNKDASKDSPPKDEKSESDSQNKDAPSNNPSKTESIANKIAIKSDLTTKNVVIEGMNVTAENHTDEHGKYQNATLTIKNELTSRDSRFDTSTVQAKRADFSGETTVNQSSIKTEETLNQNGKMVATDSILEGHKVSLNGVEATGGKVISQTDLTIKNAATVGTSLAAKKATLEDSSFKGNKDTEISSETQEPTNTEIQEPTNTETKDASSDKENAPTQIAIEGKLTTKNVTMEGMDVSAENHTDDHGTYKNTHIDVKKNFSGTNTTLEQSRVQAKNASLLGETTVNHSYVIVQDKLTQSGHLKGEEAHLEGERVFLDGAHLQQSKVISNNKLTIKNSHTVDTGISGKVVDLSDSKFKSSCLPAETTEETPKEETPEVQPEALQEKQEEAPKDNHEPKELGENQIRASKSLITNNVEMDGQLIEAGKVNFSGKTVMRNTQTKSTDTIHFEKNADVTTHNASFKAENSIVHDSENHEQTGHLIFEAKQVEASKKSTIKSGEGSNNSFYVKAEKGSFKNTMHLDNAHFDVKQLENAEDLIGQRGQSSKQVFTNSLTVQTNQTINIENMKPRDCHVAVIADAVNVKSDYKTDKNVTFIATEGKVKVDADITGSIVSLQSEKDNVEVNGKTVTGTSYVHIEAENNVLLNATEKTIKGKYDEEKEYTKAQILGGAGTEETNGAGVIIHAKNKVKVTGSDVLGVGKVSVSGDKGVRIKANSHTYVAEKWSKKKRCMGVRHGKKKYERIETKLNTSTIGSSQDKVEVFSCQGSVKGKGGDFIAKKGTDIYAEKDIKLQGIKTYTQVRKSNNSCFGLNSKKSKGRYETMKLYDFVDDGGNTRLHANSGNIQGQDVRFRGKGDIECSAPNGSVNFGASKLNNSYTKSERKFSVTSPILETGKKLASDKKGLAKQLEPTLGHAEGLMNSQNPLEQLAGASNTAVNGYNAMTALQDGTYGQQMLQGFMPKVNLSLSETNTEANWQTSSGAGMHTSGNVYLHSKDKVTLDGMQMDAKNLKVRTNQFEVKGQSFDSSFKQTNKSVTVGVTPTGGVTDASVAVSSQQTKAKRYQNCKLNIQHEIDIEANEVTLDAANLESDTIKMKTDKLTIQSRQDEMQSSSQSASASTTGNVSVNHSQSSSKEVNQVAGIHARNGIAEGDMQVKEATLIGGAVTSDGYNGFKPDKLNTQTIKDYSKTQGFGFSGNVNQISDALSNEPKEGQSSKLTTFSVSHQEKDYKAKVQATVFGEKGVNQTLGNVANLNTTSSNAKVVTRDSAHNITLDVPVEPIKNAIQKGIGFFAKPVAPTVAPSSETPVSTQAPDEEVLEDALMNQTQDPESSSEKTEAPTKTEPELVSDSPDDEVTEEPDNTYEEDFSEDREDEEERRKTGKFNPRPQIRNLTSKKGRNGEQLANADNGQYTTVEKELDASAENSQVTGRVEVVLFEGGNKEEGLYYKGRIDPIKNQLVIECSTGVQHCIEIAHGNQDLGPLGSCAYSIDAGSAEAIIKANIQAGPNKVSAMAQVELGVMGPSITASYTTPCFNFMGITFQMTATGSVGVGEKIVAGVGGELDATKMKAKGNARIGLFEGVGAQVIVSTELGLEPKNFEAHNNAYKEIFEGDSLAMSILDKIKNNQPLSDWERDHFDSKLEDVNAKAQLTNWGF